MAIRAIATVYCRYLLSDNSGIKLLNSGIGLLNDSGAGLFDDSGIGLFDHAGAVLLQAVQRQADGAESSEQRQ